MDSFINRLLEDESPALPAHLGEVSLTVSRTMSRFQNRLHAVQTDSFSNQARENASTRSLHKVPNPFTQLSRDDFRDLAQRLGVNAVFVSKLRDRQIQASTIPAQFQGVLANEMQAPLDLVIAHLKAVHGSSSKLRGISEFAQQTFEEAIRSSGLSKDKQEALFSL